MTEPPPVLVRRLILASKSRSGRPPAPVDTPAVCLRRWPARRCWSARASLLPVPFAASRAGNGARLGCQAVPTMPSNPADRYPYRYCTSDMASANDVLLQSGVASLPRKCSQDSDTPLPVSGRTAETGDVPLTSIIRCASCRQPAAFPGGKCSSPADTPPLGSGRRLRPCGVTRHRTSAASWGRLRDAPDAELTRNRSVSAGDRLVAAQPGVRTGARHTRIRRPP
jgi:hypothetical protein